MEKITRAVILELDEPEAGRINGASIDHLMGQGPGSRNPMPGARNPHQLDAFGWPVGMVLHMRDDTEQVVDPLEQKADDCSRRCSRQTRVRCPRSCLPGEEKAPVLSNPSQAR